MPAPRRALATSVRAQKCGMVMSVTTQIIFPYMSDARAPAMDVHMTPQDAGMARSFWLILSALLIGVNGYYYVNSFEGLIPRAAMTWTRSLRWTRSRRFASARQSQHAQHDQAHSAC